MRGKPALLGLLAAACDGGGTALRLTLAPTEALNPAPEVVRQVERVELQVDAPDGLAGIEQPGPAGGGIAHDRDDDGRLEWIVEAEVAGELPIFEIAPGASLDRTVDVRAFGLRDGRVVARGEAAALRFALGEVADVTVPFDLLPPFRPPRVLAIDPPEGGATGCAAAIRVEFSELMEPASVKAAVEIRDEAGNPHSPSAVAVDRQFLFGVALAPGRHMLSLSPRARDLDGAQLDQDPASLGAEPFRSTFVVTGCE